MNIRALRLVSCVPLDTTHSERMSAGVPFYRPHANHSAPNEAKTQANLVSGVSIGLIQTVRNAGNSVHRRSTFQTYRTLAATGECLGGLSAEAVEDLIVNGPLVGREVDGELLVHDKDLADFVDSQRLHLVETPMEVQLKEVAS